MRLKIPLPPLAAQEKIVADIEIIESQIASLKESLNALASAKEAILQTYLF